MTFGIPKSVEVKYDLAVVQNMLTLLKAAPFPDRAPIDAATPWELGIDYAYLKSLKTRFETEWDYSALEKKIGRFDNYLVHYEHEGDSLDLHYVHVKSPRSDAIPIILLHGWPGTFFDFHKVVEPLVNPPNNNLPAFHVVIPSLPGYFLSTLPRRDGWGISDTAGVFNGLMTSVLGYATYSGQGGDWGSMILRVMGSLFPESLTAMHFNMFIAPSVPGVDPSNYSATEKRSLQRRAEFFKSGMGYFALQNTKPFTIGLAIASSPLAVLTYIGEKIYAWSDPGLVDQQDILDTVALYFLSGSFATSVVIYNQSNKERPGLSISGKWPLKNKFGYSAFPFELGGPPKIDIAAIGPLVYHKEHSKGGHFPALDCPKEYVEDLQEFLGEHWSRL
ncbi:alpha/beta-hydrolase [Phellopilus nigrolimitatus]|nr:alpha/beta-hydrolase [Phellopilus nigrolimitatus]